MLRDERERVGKDVPALTRACAVTMMFFRQKANAIAIEHIKIENEGRMQDTPATEPQEPSLSTVNNTMGGSGNHKKENDRAVRSPP